MDIDLNDLSPEEIVDLAADIFESGMEKDASELPYGFDLNELSVDEFLEFADDIADDFEKVAYKPKIKMPASPEDADGIISTIKKHYAKRENSRRGRTAKRYVERGAEGKFGKSRVTEALGAAREYAPEAAVGTTGVVGTGIAVRRRKKRQVY